jgi:hypothetical protein
MRLLVLGIDAQGRSCVSERHEQLDFGVIQGLPGTTIARLFATNESPPVCGASGEGVTGSNNSGPGLVSWFVINHEPYAPGERHTGSPELHYRNAIDMICLLEGSGDMFVGDGGHPVEAGDCILLPGTSHAFRPGPGGCRMMGFSIGGRPA